MLFAGVGGSVRSGHASEGACEEDLACVSEGALGVGARGGAGSSFSSGGSTLPSLTHLLIMQAKL